MVRFFKRKKMEILGKFFNEWPKATDKIKINNCDCVQMNSAMKEKDEIIASLNKQMEKYENELNSMVEYNGNVKETVKQLDDINITLQMQMNEQTNEIICLRQERDSYKNEAKIAAEHLKNVEFSFNDVHLKYERTKGIIDEIKENEQNLRKCIDTHEETIKSLINQYSNLKQYTMRQFEDANVWVHRMNQEHNSLLEDKQSQIKNLQLDKLQLEHELKKKIIENNTLSAICDEVAHNSNTTYNQQCISAK